MKAMIFGATGMVGQGALKPCLGNPQVSEVLLVGRTARGPTDPRATELIQPNLFDLGSRENKLAGYDAGFFCFGTASSGTDEASYAKITHDLTLAIATILCRLNPGMTFIYVSGVGADSAENSRTMWARVRGRTENALLRLPFEAV